MNRRRRRRRRTDEGQYGEGEALPKREEPQSIGDFERMLGEEVSVSAEFDLPLCVLVARSRDRWSPEVVRRVVGMVSQGDLIALPAPGEIALALPNTEFDGAKTVEHRLREALPEAAIGIALQKAGDTAHGLLYRARAAADREYLSG